MICYGIILDFHYEKMFDVNRERIFLCTNDEYCLGCDFPYNHNFP